MLKYYYVVLCFLEFVDELCFALKVLKRTHRFVIHDGYYY